MITSTNPGVRVRTEAFARNKELYGKNVAKFIDEVARAHMLMELVLRCMPQEPRYGIWHRAYHALRHAHGIRHVYLRNPRGRHGDVCHVGSGFEQGDYG